VSNVIMVPLIAFSLTVLLINAANAVDPAPGTIDPPVATPPARSYYAPQSYAPAYTPSYASNYVSSYAPNYQNNQDNRQPLWVIPPQVNSLAAVKYYVKVGANALEMSLSFDTNGQILYVGKVDENCDCGIGCHSKTPVDQYLRYISQLVNTKSPLYTSSLIMLYMNPRNLDNLSPQAMQAAGRNWFQVVSKYLYENGNPNIYIYLVNGIKKLNYEQFIVGYERAEEQNSQLDRYFDHLQGWDHYHARDQPLQAVQDMWSRAIVPNAPNVWQSDAVSLCMSGIGAIQDCEGRLNKTILEAVLSARNIPNVKKIGFSTVVCERDMVLLLQNGFDEVSTSEVPLFLELVHSAIYNTCYRLARWADNPWTKVSSPMPGCMNGPPA